MCDYSLHAVATRAAQVDDKLVTTRFVNTLTRGFSAVGEPNVAVCLLPGTELAFDSDVSWDSGFMFFSRRKKMGARVARFRYVDSSPNGHRDALEFPDGQTVLLTNLDEGQHATVIQLPARPGAEQKPHQAEPAVAAAAI
jgi:hypothetical protein